MELYWRDKDHGQHSDKTQQHSNENDKENNSAVHERAGQNENCAGKRTKVTDDVPRRHNNWHFPDREGFRVLIHAVRPNLERERKAGNRNNKKRVPTR